MIQKKYNIICFFLILLCSSCFEIVEEVSFNEDGSGKVSLTLNLSRSRTRINSIRLLDSINDYKVPTEGEIRKHFTEVIAQIKSTKGISQVTHKLNFNDYIVTLSCQFANVEALNSVITKFSSTKEAEKIALQKHFSFNKVNKTFTRNHHYDLAAEFKKTKMEDRKVFETASITTIYRFQLPIKSSSNIKAKISGSKKAIMLKVTAQELIKKQNSIKNQISLK